MKNFIYLFSILMAFGCAGNTSNPSAPDSINAINERPTDIQDTTVSPIPDGYAPPNTSADTSQRLKDSIDSSKH